MQMIDISSVEAAIAPIADGRASGIKAKDGNLSMMVDMSGMDNTQRELLAADIKAAVKSVDGVENIRLLQTAEKIKRRLIAVASGKGGVGKSTLSANLAVAMSKAGRKVGLVDADIYGPSQPRLMNAEDKKPKAKDKQLIPVTGVGEIPMLSMGQLAKPGQAIAWRGPMAGNALSQLVEADWGAAQDLILDLPPGTGDVQLTLCQKTELTGAVVVSTPQDVALLDARKALDMFKSLNTPVLGLIENMSTFHCPHCGKESQIFGHGGVAAEAAKIGVPMLGALPIDLDTRLAGDAGTPIAAGDSPMADAYRQLARRFIDGGMA